MALIKCNNCDGMVSDKAKACPHCGSPVLTNNCSQDSKAPIQGSNEYYEQPKRKSNAGLIVAVVLGVLALLGIGSWFWYDNQQKRIALEQLQEQARQDSIAQAELREKARQGSIARAQKEEQINTIYNEYVKVLNQHEVGDYFLFDITQDGIPEIWITGYNKPEIEEQCEWPGLHIFTIVDGVARKICDATSGGAYYQGKNYIIVDWDWIGEEFRLIKLTYNGNKITEKVIRKYYYDEGTTLNISEPRVTSHGISEFSVLKEQIKSLLSN